MSKQITHRFSNLLLSMMLLLLVAGCSAAQKSGHQAGTYQGPSIDIGGGSAHAFVALDATGKPTILGIKLSEQVLKDLPAELPPGADRWEYKLALPAEATGAGYDHIVVDWNPKGHVPQGVYDIAHFDFHFYLINEAERNLITAVNEDLERANKPPEKTHMPEGYTLPPGTEIPRMGAHAIDPTSGEFNGKPFTATFIYGFYNGQMIFLEPMVSESYLKTRPHLTAPVPVPEKYALQAHYPTQYGIKYDKINEEYVVSLEKLVSR